MSVIKRGASLALWIGCTVLFLYYGVKCIRKFLCYEVGTRVDYVPTEMSKFPAFTICWKFGYKMSVLASYGYTSANASEPLDLGRFPNSTNVVDFVNELRFVPSDFLETITVKTFSKVDGAYETVLYHDDAIASPEGAPAATGSGITDMLSWTARALKDNGLCYTSEVPEKFVLAGVSKLSFRLQIKEEFHQQNFLFSLGLRAWEILFHHGNHFHRPDALRVDVENVYITEAAISHSQFIKLAGSSGCSSRMNHVYDQCWESSVNDKIREHLGCLFPWNYVELKEEDEKSLCRNESSYSGSAEELAWTEMADQTLTPCKTPCYTMALSILKSRRNILTSTVTEDFLHNTGVLDVKFNDRIETVTEYYVYDAVSMVGEAGGYLGLFLGVSCFQFFNVAFDWFLKVRGKAGGINFRIGQKAKKPHVLKA